MLMQPCEELSRQKLSHSFPRLPRSDCILSPERRPASGTGEASLNLLINIPEEENIHTEDEFHASDINQLADYLLSKGLELVNKSHDRLTKDDKLKIIKYLDEKGMFLITKSGDRVCNMLNISKFTLYNYLDIVRSEKTASNERHS